MAEYELRRVQQHLIRLETEAETYRRRDFETMAFAQGGTAAERAADVAAEIERASARLRELLSAGPA